MALKDLFAAHSGETPKAEVHTVQVAGMHCGACERLVSEALAERGASNVVANHETGTVTYEGELDKAAIAEAVTSAGFELA